MDYETKIYLDKLIEAVDSPDWWMIVLTIINVGAFIIVAYTQYKQQKYQIRLQEQQTRSQDYALYQQLYTCIKDINKLIDTYLYELLMCYGPFRDKKEEPFADKIELVSTYIRELDERWNDFELKFPLQMSTITMYMEVLIEMQNVYSVFHPMLAVEKEDKRDIKSLLHSLPRYKFNEDEIILQNILSLIGHKGTRDCVEPCLRGFVKSKKYIHESNMLGIIRERCKVE